MNMYKELILEHYQNPQNWGDLSGANVTQLGNNPLCGDVICLKLKIKQGKLADFKYIAQGCALSVACASLLSEEIIGLRLNELINYSKEDMSRLTGIELTPSRLKCSLLALETLKEALRKYVTEKV
ncbi:MAG: hypothetical protein A3F33_01695 [Candidatus Woykebacteria bacterium RIFCSPHIGHO2_12_FULL_43_10]|uniref:NIF system FeS cluster assembly NifU N-terminal domain-containing protein n=2 Tax=Candidatus Woykeibacteriota TaxID=1817899 RepID=A0A1G1WVP0_9BACT|nr:MAG: hypothetical protein A2802_02355 [Candidatus Woykebacteria bacterium RIFCSPHIGHO2_01_FULL_43_29]OGY29527.1 MAG: hypothetical protein A3F33_01695 [Candidatus Woykebacteria bacterium RIFCSPHIGHO2_12_FULL_43_10]OGY29626.1 MAG: hypothetical protein A3J50_00235 [Candidatus Woykebacteria bacterium RIFCSPHIGHO2_02_FULL_43_16b]OGY31641.1 MAG: hypothetical protein A3A61_00425 [Candidatus Woykebacteria bacterium RIFCSPLOWO2_01_FULL_43_14]